MDKKIEKLLAVPDMPEGEQGKWLVDNKIIGFGAFAMGDDAARACLADLAFRLRDEVIKTSDDSLSSGFVSIYVKCADRISNATDCFMWFMFNAQPIHWIIAALIAKELAKENNGKV